MHLATSSSFLTLFVALFSAMFLVNAAPVELKDKEVYSPQVLYPKNGTVWKSNDKHNVTWYVPQVNIMKGS